MANPSDILTIENLSIYTKKRIDPVLAVSADIREAIDYNYRTLKDPGKSSEPAPSTPLTSTATEDRAPADASSDISVARQLDRLLEEGMKARASDIHIEPDESRVRIRYRIDGILHEVASLPLNVHQPLISRIKIFSDMNIADHRRPTGWTIFL